MLTISNLASTTFQTSTSGFLHYRYDHLCTNFDHNASETSFSGDRALLTGNAVGYVYVSGSFVTTSVFGSAPPLTLTVGTGTYNTAASTGAALLTGSLTTFPFVSEFTSSGTPYTMLRASVLFTSMTAGSLGAEGYMLGTFTASGSSETVSVSGAAYFSLTRPGNCPV